MHARPVCCNLKAHLFNKLGLDLFTLPVHEKTVEARGTFASEKNKSGGKKNLEAGRALTAGLHKKIRVKFLYCIFTVRV